MIEKVINTIEKYKLLSLGDKVVVGVSGGGDSIFLLYILNEIKSAYKLELIVAHLNHKLREDASQDAEFVFEQAKKLGLLCEIEEKDVKRYCQLNKLSLEEGAREIRYKFLESVRVKYRMNKIATAHTASDEAETFILRIGRGCGGRGLLCIPPKRGKIIRPLIEIEREEIRKFLESHKIPYKVDASNYDYSVPRNFVRHNILPKVKELFTDFPAKILRLREILAPEEEVLNEVTQKRIREISLSYGDNELLLDLSGFLKTNLAIKRRILRTACEVIGKKICPRFEEIENAIKYIENSASGQAFKLQEVMIHKSCGKIKISKSSLSGTQKGILLSIPGEVEMNGIKISSNLKPQTSNLIYDDTKRVYFDIDKLKLPLFVRTREEGDIFCGFGYKKKLKKVFIDDKIPVWERRTIPLVVDSLGILWIVGKRRAYRALVDENTTKIVEIQIK
jgi:tRNA(Ile)-lysidine synthase